MFTKKIQIIFMAGILFLCSIFFMFGCGHEEINETLSAPSMVHDINTGGSFYPGNFRVSNNKLYFEANDGTNGVELWVYDGSSTPSMVYDIC
ncbi:MAG: hypothetical protein B6I26_08530 [Desulfobacteraceae bacterium 4572_130]|nr:MAG: hypothetical protein B6I26_08530 [Desulfobacteraceae bacterium 4572_130]